MRRNVIKWLGLTPFMLPFVKFNEIADYLALGENTQTMPVLFLGHGSPMNAIEENDFVRGFRTLAKDLPKPKSVLCISAHWYTKGTMVTGMEMPKTIHDFYGFPDELYQVKYPAPGSPSLAGEIKQRLEPTEVGISDDWGLDHGAWSVLKHLFPEADVPVVQISIDRTLQPENHFQLGARLKELRNKGVLIVGSGNIVHNLGLVDFANFHRDNYGFDWAMEARQEINQLILDGHYTPLFDYWRHSKAFQLAIPTPDHFLPLLYILGAKEKKEEIQLFNDKLLAGSLSMTSLRIG